MSRIFISYRRDDSAGYAGRLYDRLSERFGQGQIFMDIDTIEPGLDFVEVIEKAVGSCGVLIALIGRQWLTITDATGHRRLDNPEDFVRLEIATALDRNIRVIPVLVRGATMPRSTDLPDALKKLARRNALEISDTRFHYDVDRLIETLEKVLGVSEPAPPTPKVRRREKAAPARQPIEPEMVLIPAGEFLYGYDKKKVTLPEFWIDKTPVTNAEYARFVAVTGHRPPKHWEGKTPPDELRDHPVTYVSWHDAVAYGKWAGKRLPTEEEWEKAARGSDGRKYPWGNQQPTSQLCNFDYTEGGTTPVGRYSPQGDSPYGCVDMAGNVWEWTASDYEYGEWAKVLRGSSWRGERGDVGCAEYFWRPPDYRDSVVGFRCARGSHSPGQVRFLSSGDVGAASVGVSRQKLI